MSQNANQPPPPNSESHEATARKWLENMVAKSPAFESTEAWNCTQFDPVAIPGLRISSIAAGRVLCSFRVPTSLADGEGNWHSGAIATLMDDVCAAAIMSIVGVIKISVDFSISFFSHARINEEVEIEAGILDDQGRLTAVEAVVRIKETGRLVAIGRQWMSSLRSAHRSYL
ncbi:hypothetical protein HPP92_023597 [Vanilla planifolia]|uniref:Acyl-coenzyme A thioesterase 13 n=1 Tax=Vanilla planifolia TaxID=51239 RepID=A0A835PM23_VANPL|nr:hypothetical protein HPP92_023909 [Vanilla planifolia]KAG0455809.1 hypothetical protein HPP92_023597 [Vanilla planifolia]